MNSCLQHIDLIAAAPDGVKRLRELILELAVRGKLVPQDPNDEPASELLKRIQAEKARLVAEGNIRKDKTLPAIGEDENPFELPVGWEWVRLGDVSRNVQYGYTASADHLERSVLMLRITDIQNDQVNWESVPGCLIDNENLPSYALTNGDILITRTGGTIGKSYLVSGLSEVAVFASYLIRIQRLNENNPPYTKTYLGSQLYWGQLFASSMGTGQPNVNGSALKSLLFPLPPLAEQHRIVAKVDELMALCDQLEAQQTNGTKTHSTLVKALLDALTQSQSAADFITQWQRISQHFDSLFSTEASIDALKQTILQLAVMGRLVPQDPNDEPASELLKRIQAEKARLVAEGKIRKDKPLPAIGDDDNPFELPVGWEWAFFGTVMISRDGERIPVSKEERDHREKLYDYYGASGVIDKIDGFIFDKPLLLIGEDGANLVNRSTPIAFIARGKYWVNNHAHVLDGTTVDFLRYIGLYINAIDLKPYVTGTAQPKMNQAKMNSIPIALPPEAEQIRILTRVDEVMALCDQLADRLKAAREVSGRYASAAIAAALKAA